MHPDAEALLVFWFGELGDDGAPPPDRRARWFAPPEGFDAELATRFGALVERALAGELESWAQEPHGRLALVLLLDQLPRNVFRGTAKAFAGDACALGLTLDAIGSGEAGALAPVERSLLYMPLMHAEDPELQDRSVALYTELTELAPAAVAETLGGNRDYAVTHRDVITRFGRYPGRNEALGRESTPEEHAYLKEGGGS